MRKVCGGTLVLMLAVFGMAAYGAGVLPVEEAAQGWISLFDGETLFGWNQIGDAQWEVVDGAMVCQEGTGGWIATSTRFGDCELVVKIRVKRGTSAGVVYSGSGNGHIADHGGHVVTIQEPKDEATIWREVRLTLSGAIVTASIDAADVQQPERNTAMGFIGVQFHSKGGKVEVSEAKLRPLNTTPLFNGEDLTGWNTIPDHPSVFSVVDGALNIKNGNGQIETAGVYKDFVLQLDIISNGEHLNSGVFVRGPVGVFWKGYESQVRNEWRRDDRTKPIDFGTGGNYGNQQARQVVSSDHEWFSKTIVCDGNHMAVWINGYLASDFTDTRPVSPDSNGKGGYVPGPGTIHLQGHDPTTDLSFKNIRIQEYPAG